MMIAMNLATQLKRAVGLLEKVINQTERRVFHNEKVPVADKVVSFFEDHTDIIVKKRRETQFVHKIFLTIGTFNLILDCLIANGNPADSECVSNWGFQMDTSHDHPQSGWHEESP